MLSITGCQTPIRRPISRMMSIALSMPGPGTASVAETFVQAPRALILSIRVTATIATTKSATTLTKRNAAVMTMTAKAGATPVLAGGPGETRGLFVERKKGRPKDLRYGISGAK